MAVLWGFSRSLIPHELGEKSWRTETGWHTKHLRDWMAHQASQGCLILMSPYATRIWSEYDVTMCYPPSITGAVAFSCTLEAVRCTKVRPQMELAGSMRRCCQLCSDRLQCSMSFSVSSIAPQVQIELWISLSILKFGLRRPVNNQPVFLTQSNS